MGTALAAEIDLERAVQVVTDASGMSDLLRRTIGEQIAIEAVLAGGLWRAHVDPNQLEVAVLNLAVNARDAMPAGGKLTIETANAYLDEGYAAVQAEVVPGHTSICVSDTGIGMTKQVLARAFEPSSPPRKSGKAPVLGSRRSMASSNSRAVTSRSIRSRNRARRSNSTCRGCMAMPTSERPDQRRAARSAADAETILVVEDDDDVRTYSRRSCANWAIGP